MKPRLHTLFALLLATTALPGCFIFIDDPSPPPVRTNAAPIVATSGTWWRCDYDVARGDYLFEFQASVDDPDGTADIEAVSVTVFPAGRTDFTIAAFDLFEEDAGLWAGLVWEAESDLLCSEPIDVLFEAFDWQGASDALLLPY